MDRNQIIGFSLLAALVIAYFTWNQHEQTVYQEQKRKADSIAAATRPKVDSPKAAAVAAAAVADTAGADSATKARIAAMPPAFNGEAKTVTLENKQLALQFSTKGAYPVAANLKEYKTYRQAPLFLWNGAGNQLSAILPVDNGRSTADLYYTPTTRTEANGDKVIDFTADLGSGRKVDIIYTLPADDYMMRCNVVLTGLPASELKLTWNTAGLHTEKDVDNERMATQVYYRDKNGENDYFTVRTEDKKIDNTDAASWVGFRKQYFSTVLLADDQFSRKEVRYFAKQGDTNIIANNMVSLILPLKAGAGTQSGSMRWYIGPNDYHTLQRYKANMEDMVPLGYGIMAFVKYINKYFLIPIFYFLSSFISNYALIIVLMTIFIRLILSFFTYKSYLSSAKMRVLKPELDELRAKVGDDQQKFSMEQMKLYRSAGVNPLGGCLPMLFQLPILLSMYYMFPSFIEFRQKSFLWVNDMSTYDSVLDFGFNIPFYGDHISLFTLLMTATSLFLAIYNRNMTPQDPNNPMMKYMPYVFPVILMGVFNKMAAALTFYYTCSNLLSIAQQFIIQKYFIDEKKIHAELQANKSKPAVQSKWQQRLEEMQKLQQERAKTPPRKKG